MPGSYLVWKGEQAARSVRARLFDDLRRLAKGAKARARVYCPVDTSKLRNSIDAVPDIRTMRIYIGSDVFYAGFQEKGTDHGVPAVHFLERGLNEEVASFRFSTAH
jgi:hypothetical protein